MKRLISLTLAGFLAVGSSEAKTIDLSNMSDPAGEFEVAFCARPSPEHEKPGHAFVSFSHKQPDGKRDFFAIGHTISSSDGASAAWSYFGDPITGYLKEELYTSIKQNCLNAKVNKSEYDKAIALTKDPLASLGLSRDGAIIFQAYKLGDKDCMSFMIKVAAVLKPNGLNVPDRGATELPMDYMVRFIGAN